MYFHMPIKLKLLILISNRLVIGLLKPVKRCEVRVVKFPR